MPGYSSTDEDPLFQKFRKSLCYRAEYLLLDTFEKTSQQIKQLREDKGLTQEDLATAMECSPRKVRSLEDELDSKHSLLILAKAADALGCRLDIIFTPIQEGEKDEPTT